MKEYKLIICHDDNDFNKAASDGWVFRAVMRGAQCLFERDAESIDEAYKANIEAIRGKKVKKPAPKKPAKKK